MVQSQRTEHNKTNSAYAVNRAADLRRYAIGRINMKNVIIALLVVILAGCASSQNNFDVVKIDADGTTYLNEKPTPLSDLSKSFTKESVIIEAHPSIPFTKFAEVMKEAEKAGIKQISLPNREKQK